MRSRWIEGPFNLARVAPGAIVAMACLAGPTAAQFTSSPSILSLLPVQGTLEIGDQIEGRLSESDFEFQGQLVQAFDFEAPQGAPVTIDVMSDAFDSYVYLIGPDGTQLDSDDDAAGGCNARISTVLPSAGRYIVVAASLAGAGGDFTIRTDDQQHPAATGACGSGEIQDDLLAVLTSLDPTGSISLGGEVSDQLEEGDPRLADGSFMKAYELIGTPGKTVVVDLVSRAFDAMVFIIDPRGESYTSDDDSGGACNSRIEVTLGAQPHTVVVTSFVSDGAGYFALSVSEEAGPPSEASCPG
ncbi:MAG: PPC domain-containing protein [Gemmatimonadota bacterium]